MAVLNAWQKIDRVLSGQPFGNGSDGAYSSATVPTLKVKSCSGTATNTKFAADTDASPFEVGDVILLHQSRGTGVGQWEIVKVASVGSDEYNVTTALNYTYTDSGASQAQAIKVPMYSSVTVQSGTWSHTDWGGNVGGLFAIACSGTFTTTGTIEMNGGNSTAAQNQSTSAGATGGGFVGAESVYAQNGEQGEGTAGATGTQSTNANGNGGGGGLNDESGAGGGNGAAGTNGSGSATGGAADGSADLTDFVFGGGGGAGRDATDDPSNRRSGGGSGGGGIIIFAKTVAEVAGGITANGGVAADCAKPGGDGGGGSILIACETATLGTTKVTATGGAGGTAGGDGGTGRIAVHHSGTVTGTTNPTFTDVEDSSLVETEYTGNAMFFGGGVTIG